MDNSSNKTETLLLQAVLFIVTGSNFSGTFMTSAANLMIPRIGAEFLINAGAVGWINSVYVIFIAAFAIPFGKIADALGRRKVFVWGTLGFAFSSFLFLFVPNFSFLLILRALQGISGGLMFGTNFALLTEFYPADKRGKALGISTAATYLGTALGPPLAGWISQLFGWRSVFLLTAIFAGTVGFSALYFLPKGTVRTGKRFEDKTGGILYSLSIITIMYGLSTFSDLKKGPVILAAGILLTVLFLRHEKRIADPVLQLRLFAGNLRFSMAGVATIINFGSIYSVTYFLSIYLQVVRGMGGGKAGLILLAYPVTIVLLSSSTGKLSDRISPFKLSSLGMLICGISLILLSFLSSDTTIPVIVLKLVLAGISFSFFSSPNTNAVMSCVDKKDLGIAGALIPTGRTIGQTLSMAFSITIISLKTGNATLAEADPGQLLSGLRVVFLTFAFFCLLSVYLSRWARIKSEKSCLDT